MKTFLPLLVIALAAVFASAQQPDAQLLAYINSIQAVDNHAHVFAPDVPDDKGYDALRCDVMPQTMTLAPGNLRFGPSTQSTWKALFGVVPSTGDEADHKRLDMEAKLRKEHGDNYYDWVLKQSGIDVVLANRVAMTPGLKPPNFRWVPYVDALLFPLNNEALKKANPDRQALFQSEEELLRVYVQQAQLASIPATLDEYVGKLLRPILQNQKQAGAVAIKFEAAYLRRLNFAPSEHDVAADIYRKSLNGPAPSAANYTIVQDYLFHEIAAEAGKIGLAVHIHTGAGCGESFDDAGSDPMQLINVLNDPTLRGTNFVMLHGGTPFNRHITTLIVKPNAYVDTSVIELEYSPQEVARILRPWLEMMPEHILFGTDADFFSPGMAWIETTWLGSHNARLALAIALSEMVKDNVISMPRAKEIAASVLRENAWKLYHLDVPGGRAEGVVTK